MFYQTVLKISKKKIHTFLNIQSYYSRSCLAILDKLSSDASDKIDPHP